MAERSLNKAMLIGRLGGDPEIRFTPGGQAVANFRVATSESWINKNGEREERTEWHRIVAWGKLAEIINQYLSKGRQVYLEGRIQTREWEDRDGNKRWTTEIVANQMIMLGGRGEAGASDSKPSSTKAEEPPSDNYAPEDSAPEDDIPF